MADAETQFDVHHDIGDGGIVLTVVGEFDASCVGYFEGRVNETLQAAPDGAAKRLSVDVGPTDLLDSAAIGSLLRLHRDREAAGGEMTVRISRPFQRTLFEVTGVGYLLSEDGVGP